MLIVELTSRAKRFSELDENIPQEAVVQMHHRFAPILARSNQPDGDAVVIGVGVELRMAAKTADIGLVRKIDGDLGLVANRMQ